jgi:phosphoserine aminotransferase
VEKMGGLPAMVERSEASLTAIKAFVDENDWINFLAQDASTLSSTSVCLTLELNDSQVKQLIKLLEDEGVAYDIGSYRDAPTGLRIWCGATIESEDVKALMPWIKWAYKQVSA